MTTQEHLLSILAEECGEVAQRSIKALSFGLAEVQPGQPLANAERIRQEFADLCGVYEMIGLNPPSRADIEAKKLKVQKFLAYSAECGCVDSARCCSKRHNESSSATAADKRGGS